MAETPKERFNSSIRPLKRQEIGWSLDRHVLERQRGIPGASGEFTLLFQQIALATRIIASRVNQAGLADILGLTGTINTHGEKVQKLDHFAHQTIVHSVEAGGHVCIMASEEEESAIAISPEYPSGRYVLVFDPLDGSGNIDVNATIGTIFSIYKRKSKSGPGSLADCLRQGHEQVAAGYVLYGSSTILVYTVGDGVHGFTLDPSIGEFFLSHENIKMPERGDSYSVNEGHRSKWPESVRNWVDWLKTPSEDGARPYAQRYIGTLVADFHRILLKGGIFAHPAHVKKPAGKLRLLYEASPLAFIAEVAGGSATNGREPILGLMPTELHQRVPLFIGSKLDMEDALGFLNA